MLYFFLRCKDSWAMAKRHIIKATEAATFDKGEKIRSSTKKDKHESNENISAEIQTLTPFSKYDIRMYAENKIGMSSASFETLSVYTKEEAPEGPPTSVIAVSNTSQSLIISWKVGKTN